jgi:hypothetical protein
MASELTAARLPTMALGAVTLLAALLRLPGLAQLAWTPEELASAGGDPFLARAPALVLGLVAVPWCAALLAPRCGATVALAAALLIAASPWHVHASRLATTDSALFLATFAALASFVGPATAPTALARAIRLVATAAAIVLIARHAPPAIAPQRAPFLFGDLAPGVLLLAALLLLLRAPVPGGRLVVVLAALLLILRLLPPELQRDAARWSAPAAAAVVLAAALALGRLIEATQSRRAQLALWTMALVPGLPSLIGEQQDGGRFDVRALEPAFAAQRRAGEPLYACVPALTARELKSAAQPIEPLLDGQAALPADRPAWIVLLLERGRLAATTPLPRDFESRLRLVASSAPRRFDLRRYETRLYRWEPAP